MTQVDFHILPTNNLDERIRYVCRLVEKVAHRGHRILIKAHDEAEARLLDKRLWDFKPESFLPHQIMNEEDNLSEIHISWKEDSGDHDDVLINLGLSIPDYFSRFERVLEVVCQEEALLESGRQHYKFYNDRGYPLKRHDLRPQQ